MLYDDGEADAAGEYMDISLQFGLIVMFSNVLPLAAFLCLVANGMKLYAMNLEFKYRRRNEPELAFGINEFMEIFYSLSYFAVIVQILIAKFVSTRYIDIFITSESYKFYWNEIGLLVFFILAEHVVILFKLWLSSAINDAANAGREDNERNKGVYRRDMERKEDARLTIIKKVQSKISNIVYRNKAPGFSNVKKISKKEAKISQV